MHHIKKQPLEMFYKKAVLKNISIFKGKHMYWSPFLIKGLQPCNFISINKRLQNRCFPANVAKF